MVRAVEVGILGRLRKALPLVVLLALVVAVVNWFGLPSWPTGSTPGRVIDKIDLSSAAEIDSRLAHGTPYSADMVISPANRPGSWR